MKTLKMFAYAGALFYPGDEVPRHFIPPNDLELLQHGEFVETPKVKAKKEKKNQDADLDPPIKEH